MADPLRARLKEAIARRVGSDEKAEVILQRIASRLDGYTHAEVVEMHPMPDPRTEAE